jgi:arabinan endo-1,5-alpha-L-arabinosidase
MQAVPGGRPAPTSSPAAATTPGRRTSFASAIKYFLYYSAPGTQPKSAIGCSSARTLDPASPTTSGGRRPVVWSDGVEDSNAIDPGVFRDPTNGTLWLTYGSYFGYIRSWSSIRRPASGCIPSEAVNVAINSEASIMIFRDGWYYLLVTHGSCCRARTPLQHPHGPIAKSDRPVPRQHGRRHAAGRRQAVRRLERPHIGPGHFGLLDLGDGRQKFSLHYEADLDRGGISVLDIRPLLWRDGWPVAGDNLPPALRIESARTGTALEMAVQGAPVAAPPRAGRSPPGRGRASGRHRGRHPHRDRLFRRRRRTR